MKRLLLLYSKLIIVFKFLEIKITFLSFSNKVWISTVKLQKCILGVHIMFYPKQRLCPTFCLFQSNTTLRKLKLCFSFNLTKRFKRFWHKTLFISDVTLRFFCLRFVSPHIYKSIGWGSCRSLQLHMPCMSSKQDDQQNPNVLPRACVTISLNHPRINIKVSYHGFSMANGYFCLCLKRKLKVE